MKDGKEGSGKYRTPCSICESIDFHKPIEKKSRLSYCVICRRDKFNLRYERVKSNPELYKKKLEYNKKWHTANKKRLSAYNKKHENLNREKRQRQKREYYLKNKEYILKRNRKWKADNRKKKKNPCTSRHIWRVYENDRIKRLKVTNQLLYL